MTDTQQMAQALYTLFSPDVEYIARQTGLVQRDSPLNGFRFLLIWVLGMLEKPDASLEFLTQVGDDLGVSVTRQALQQRLPAAVPFMQRLFAQARAQLQQHTPVPLSLLQPFAAVTVLDSSMLALPPTLAAPWPAAGGKGPTAGCKLQVLWDFLRDTFAVEVTAARVPDQRYIQRFLEVPAQLVVPGGLVLFDLGYFVLRVFQAIAQAQAYFISRYDLQAALYDPATGQRCDLWAYLQAAPADQDQFELPVLLGARERVACRVIAQRLPLAVVAERQRALAQRSWHKRKRAPSVERVAWLAWNVYLTNVPAAQLRGEQVVLLYVLRWQIELLFRLWKHEARLDRVAGKHEPRVWCELYAKLIALMVFHFLTDPLRWLQVGPEGALDVASTISTISTVSTISTASTGSTASELSLPKAFQTLGRYARDLARAFQDWHSLPQVLPPLLDKLIESCLRHALKDRRRTRLSTCRQVDRAVLQRCRARGTPAPVSSPAHSCA